MPVDLFNIFMPMLALCMTIIATVTSLLLWEANKTLADLSDYIKRLQEDKEEAAFTLYRVKAGNDKLISLIESRECRLFMTISGVEVPIGRDEILREALTRKLSYAVREGGTVTTKELDVIVDGGENYD